MAEITRPGPLAELLGEPSKDPRVQEQLIEVLEKVCGSYSYAEKRDRSNSPS